MSGEFNEKAAVNGAETPRKGKRRRRGRQREEGLEEEPSTTNTSIEDTPLQYRGRRSSALPEVGLYWYDVLTRYGGLETAAATTYAQLFATAGLPFPSPDANVYLTHELLASLGVVSPGDRCRIMLACSRMPELKAHSGEGDDRANSDARGSIQLDDVSPLSYESDATKVFLRRYCPRDGAFTWIDLVGKDLPEPSDGAEVPTHKLAESPLFAESRLRVNVARDGLLDASLTSPRATTFEWDACYEQILDAIAGRNAKGDGHEGEHLLNGASQRKAAVAVEQIDSHSLESNEGEELLSDLLATKLPLPQLRIARSQPSKCAFVLRVCTLDVDEEDDTMRSLTNRWTIFVDAANQLVVTIHRVDSMALALLRDALPGGLIPSGVTFKEFLSQIIERFVVEYEKAIDSAEEWLDACEARMLSSSAQLSSTSDDLLTSLFHLQRRASVYDRMVVLSRSLLQKEVMRHLDLSGDLQVLDPRFQHLQEKTVDLGSRAQNLLEIHLSLTGYHTNELMKMLTKFSMFFTPITFLAGVWGMNFDNMPELHLSWGYYGALGLMLAIALGILGWFRWSGI